MKEEMNENLKTYYEKKIEKIRTARQIIKTKLESRENG